MVEVSASILSIEHENAIQTLYDLEAAKINYFHIDVMDGEFVKNNTIDVMQEYCQYLNSISNLPLDVHLMVKDVKKHISDFSVFEPNIITFHIEAVENKEEVKEVIEFVKENNIKVGISIKPNTKIEEIYEFLPYIHLVLVMTVEPGEGGQALITETIKKVEELNKYREENKLDFYIEADGGINIENAQTLKDLDVDIIVAGSAIVKSENFAETVKKFKLN